MATQSVSEPAVAGGKVEKMEVILMVLAAYFAGLIMGLLRP